MDEQLNLTTTNVHSLRHTNGDISFYQHKGLQVHTFKHREFLKTTLKLIRKFFFDSVQKQGIYRPKFENRLNMKGLFAIAANNQLF